MSLTQQEASPGNRIDHPTFGEVDILATVASDTGPLLLLSNGAMIVQGDLSDGGTDVFYVGATSGIKQEEAEKKAEAEKAQQEKDRKDAAAARAAVNPPASPFPAATPADPGATGTTENPPPAPAPDAPPTA